MLSLLLTLIFFPGLFNDHLESQKPFTPEMAKMVTSFLERLPPPVCLIAHNGNNFDYPLLHTEMKRVNESLPGSLLCADSLECFREMMSEQIAAEMERDATSMRLDSEQTPPKRTSSCDDVPVGVKKPRKNPIMQDILYSNVNKEAATRRLDFEADDKSEVGCSTDGSSISQTNADSKTGMQKQLSSRIAIRTRMAVKQDTSVVKKLTFTDDETHSIKDRNLAENQESIGVSKTTGLSSVDSLERLESHDLTSTQHECLLPINMPTPESSRMLKNSADVETSAAVGQSQEGGYVPHRSPDCHKANVNPVKSCTDKSSERAISSDSKGTSNLDSQSSITDAEFVLAVENIENSSTSHKFIPNTAEVAERKHHENSPVSTSAVHSVIDAKQETNSDHHESNLGQQDGIHNCPKIALTRESKLKYDSVPSSSYSEVLSPDMNTIPLPVTKHYPFITISPTTSAQMRNENQQKSDEVVHARLTSPTPIKRTASTTTTESSPVKTFPSRLSFKLQEIYRRSYGQLPPAAHNAEDDCITLLKVVRKHSPQFLDWVDKHAVPFNTVSPMY